MPMKRRLPPAAVLSALFLLCASCGREPAPEAPAGGTAEQLAARIVVKHFYRFDAERVKFIDDICAAAKGYEYMAELQIKAGQE